MKLHVFPFQPAQLGVSIAWDLTRKGRVRYRRADEVLADDPAIEMAVDGPMFDEGGRLAVRYLDLDAGIDVKTRRPREGLCFSVVDGVGFVLPHDRVSDGARVAVQCWPTLVRHGEVSRASHKTHVHRAALARLNDGRFAFVLGKGHLEHFAHAIAELPDVIDAANLDGGNSTDLLTRAGERRGYPKPNPVASHLVVRRAT